jgi:hypothetical protein
MPKPSFPTLPLTEKSPISSRVPVDSGMLNAGPRVADCTGSTVSSIAAPGAPPGTNLSGPENFTVAASPGSA